MPKCPAPSKISGSRSSAPGQTWRAMHQGSTILVIVHFLLPTNTGTGSPSRPLLTARFHAHHSTKRRLLGPPLQQHWFLRPSRFGLPKRALQHAASIANRVVGKWEGFPGFWTLLVDHFTHERLFLTSTCGIPLPLQNDDIFQVCGPRSGFSMCPMMSAMLMRTRRRRVFPNWTDCTAICGLQDLLSGS